MVILDIYMRLLIHDFETYRYFNVTSGVASIPTVSSNGNIKKLC